DAHGEPAQRSPQEQQSRVPAKATDPAQVLAPAARLPEEEDGDEDRQPDADEPDGQRRAGALLWPVAVSPIAPGRRREREDARDGRAGHERSATPLRDHVPEATPRDPGAQS